MPGVTVDGGDPLAVHDALSAAVARARAGEGPTLVESLVYRLSAHGNSIAPPGVPLHYPEHEAVARFGAVEEYEAAKRGDPVPRFRAVLVAAGVLGDDLARSIAADAAEEMQGAVDAALAAPLPEPAAALQHVYAEALG